MLPAHLDVYAVNVGLLMRTRQLDRTRQRSIGGMGSPGRLGGPLLCQRRHRPLLLLQHILRLCPLIHHLLHQDLGGSAGVALGLGQRFLDLVLGGHRVALAEVGHLLVEQLLLLRSVVRLRRLLVLLPFARPAGPRLRLGFWLGLLRRARLGLGLGLRLRLRLAPT